jgi:hypothetical protein
MPGCILPLRSTAGQRTPRGICGGVSIEIDACWTWGAGDTAGSRLITKHASAAAEFKQHRRSLFSIAIFGLQHPASAQTSGSGLVGNGRTHV